MSLTCVMAVSGRKSADQIDPKTGALIKEGRFYGEVHVVKGRPKADATGLPVSVIRCNDPQLIEDMRKNVPGLFDLETSIEGRGEWIAEVCFAADYRGPVGRYNFTPAGIKEQPAHQAPPKPTAPPAMAVGR